MSTLDIARAPLSRQPLRFLLTAPVWGCVAGGWLAWHGHDLFASRWTPPTVVLVHLLTLGVLGNAMLGALTQFLPVAAASTFPGSSAPLLHAMLNMGLLLFIPGLMYGYPFVLAPAALLLGLSLLCFAAIALKAVLKGQAEFPLRLGLGVALAALALTALLGLLLCAVLLGDTRAALLPLDRLTDVHAAIGLLGWVLMLMAAVGRITMPMFQGTPPVPAAAYLGWIGLALAGLAAGVAARLAGSSDALLIGAAIPALLLMGGSLLLQSRIPRRRNPALTRFWACGAGAVGAAGLWLLLALVWPSARGSAQFNGLAPVVLGLGIGLPLMMQGMLFEITAFLGWIGLRRACPRGLRIPSVDVLMPETDKNRALILHLAAAALLMLALYWPGLTMAAGSTLACAYALTGFFMLRCLRRARSFLETHTPHTRDNHQ